MFVALLGAVVTATRIHFHGEPLERDLTTYAYVAHRLLAGDSLYESVWDHKPPAIYAAYGLAEVLFGYGDVAVTALGIAVALATLAAMFAFLRRAEGRVAAWAGAAVFSVVSSSTTLEANQPNVEVFLNLALALALFAIGRGSLLGAGAALALGSLFKPNFVFFALPFAWLALSRRRWGAFLAVGVPGAVAWSAVAGSFALAGRFEPFVDAVFRFNWGYSSGLTAAFAAIRADPSVLVPAGLREIAAVAAPALGWLLLRASNGALGASFHRWLVLGAFLAVISPGRFHPHYFQLWIPLVAIGAGLLVADASARLRAPVAMRRAAVAAILFVFALELAPEARRDLARTPAEVSTAKYGTIFVDAATIGVWIGQHTEPEDLVYEWGSETGLYFYSRRRCPTTFCYLEPLTIGDEDARNARKVRVRDEVTAARPRIFVWARPYGRPEETFFSDLLREHYRLVGSVGAFDVYESLAVTAGSPRS